MNMFQISNFSDIVLDTNTFVLAPVIVNHSLITKWGSKRNISLEVAASFSLDAVLSPCI